MSKTKSFSVYRKIDESIVVDGTLTITITSASTKGAMLLVEVNGPQRIASVPSSKRGCVLSVLFWTLNLLNPWKKRRKR